MAALSHSAFADVHKVEGLRGIYIASVIQSNGNSSGSKPFWAPVALGRLETTFKIALLRSEFGYQYQRSNQNPANTYSSVHSRVYLDPTTLSRGYGVRNHV